MTKPFICYGAIAATCISFTWASNQKFYDEQVFRGLKAVNTIIYPQIFPLNSQTQFEEKAGKKATDTLKRKRPDGKRKGCKKKYSRLEEGTLPTGMPVINEAADLRLPSFEEFYEESDPGQQEGTVTPLPFTFPPLNSEETRGTTRKTFTVRQTYLEVKDGNLATRDVLLTFKEPGDEPDFVDDLEDLLDGLSLGGKKGS